MQNHSYENDFDLHENETARRTHFHKKGFALRLVLKQGHKGTRKWPIWSEIIRVISKSNERAARVRFEITSMISDQNCTPLSSITTLLNPFQLKSSKYRTWLIQIFY